MGLLIDAAHYCKPKCLGLRRAQMRYANILLCCTSNGLSDWVNRYRARTSGRTTRAALMLVTNLFMSEFLCGPVGGWCSIGYVREGRGEAEHHSTI